MSNQMRKLFLTDYGDGRRVLMLEGAAGKTMTRQTHDATGRRLVHSMQTAALDVLASSQIGGAHVLADVENAVNDAVLATKGGELPSERVMRLASARRSWRR